MDEDDEDEVGRDQADYFKQFSDYMQSLMQDKDKMKQAMTPIMDFQKKMFEGMGMDNLLSGAVGGEEGGESVQETLSRIAQSVKRISSRTKRIEERLESLHRFVTGEEEEKGE